MTLPTLPTARLVLQPVRAEDADELAPLLDDPALHAAAGGTPRSVAELRCRYAALAAGRSPDGRQRWMCWVLRLRADGRAVGTVEANEYRVESRRVADLAWVVAVSHQRRGYAAEAAGAVCGQLAARGVVEVRAGVRPVNLASQRVAARLGMCPGELGADGEVRWSATLIPQPTGRDQPGNP